MRTRRKTQKTMETARVVEIEAGNWKVESFSGRGTWWTVKRSRRGKWRCACPAWIYQRGPQDEHADCKHIVRVQRWRRARRRILREALEGSALRRAA